MALFAIVAVAVIVLFQAAAARAVSGSSKTDLAQTTKSQTPQPSLTYQATPFSPTGSSPSKPNYPGAGAKPAGVVTSNNRTQGVVQMYVTGALNARGIDISGNVLFDYSGFQDGNQSFMYKAGAILDHIDLMSFNGLVHIQVYYQTTDIANVGALTEPSVNDPNGGMVPVGETASTGLPPDTPYPASTPDYSMPAPTPNGAYDPSGLSSWYGTPAYDASVNSGA